MRMHDLITQSCKGFSIDDLVWSFDWFISEVIGIAGMDEVSVIIRVVAQIFYQALAESSKGWKSLNFYSVVVQHLGFPV